MVLILPPVLVQGPVIYKFIYLCISTSSLLVPFLCQISLILATTSLLSFFPLLPSASKRWRNVMKCYPWLCKFWFCKIAEVTRDFPTWTNRRNEPDMDQNVVRKGKCPRFGPFLHCYLFMVHLWHFLITWWLWPTGESGATNLKASHGALLGRQPESQSYLAWM